MLVNSLGPVIVEFCHNTFLLYDIRTEMFVSFIFKPQQENEESSIPNDKVENDSTDVVDGDDDAQNRNIPRPSSAKGQRRRPKNENGDGTLYTKVFKLRPKLLKMNN